MTKLCHERWLCLLCLRHQEQACKPSEGWGKPRLDDTSSLLPLSLTQLPPGLKEWDQQDWRVRGHCQLQRQKDGPEVSPPQTSSRFYYMISWCSAPDMKPRWRCIDQESGKDLNVNLNLVYYLTYTVAMNKCSFYKPGRIVPRLRPT